APLLAAGLAKRQRWAHRVLPWWNTGGLLLVATIFTIAVLSAPGPQRVFLNEPSSAAAGTLPWIWLPGLLVPLAVWTHVVVFVRLGSGTDARPGRAHASTGAGPDLTPRGGRRR
ncbi:MAG: hypothetical protein ACK4N5_15415, partial [Myxococcales bacterium]